MQGEAHARFRDSDPPPPPASRIFPPGATAPDPLLCGELILSVQDDQKGEREGWG